MSHELRMNKKRRTEIRDSMNKNGMTRRELEDYIMDGWGYQEKGAMEKIEELMRLKYCFVRGNKFYPFIFTGDDKEQQR